jgi:hypothetical protein
MSRDITGRAISGSSHELFVRQDGPVDGKLRRRRLVAA